MFDNMDSYQIAFWICAISGSVFFVLKALMSIMAGLDHGLDVNTAEHEFGHEGSDGSDAAFKVVSINSLTGFVMMFGWMGLASYEQFGLSAPVSLLIALLAGLLALYITGAIFQAASKLTDPGAQFRLHDALGATATVYQRIPASGKGQIQMSLAGMTREIEAVSEHGIDIPSNDSVKIVKIVDSNTVSVEKVQ